MRENGFRHPPPQWLVWRAEKEGLSGSGLPFCKVAIEPEAVVGTLFGVKLHGENVICCNGTGKALAVMTNPYSQARILRNRKVAVNEIEGGAVGDAGPQHVVAHLDDGVPAHVRHLESGAGRLRCGRCARVGWPGDVAVSDGRGVLGAGKTPDPAGENVQGLHIPFVTAGEQHLFAYT